MESLTIVVQFSGAVTMNSDHKGFAVAEASGKVLSATSLSDVPDTTAHLSSSLFISESRFWESGVIAFPDDKGALYFETRAPGEMLPVSGGSLGTVAWFVTHGIGFFEGFSGIITGNFRADADGRFVDHQVIKVTRN